MKLGRLIHYLFFKLRGLLREARKSSGVKQMVSEIPSKKGKKKSVYGTYFISLIRSLMNFCKVLTQRFFRELRRQVQMQ